MRNIRCCQVLLIAVVSGCSADVQTTGDSVKLEAEVPKIEVQGTPDLNPKTDHDVDVDTPKPGDN
jgi:hypothetical protein